MRALQAAAISFAVLITAGSVMAQDDAPERRGPRDGERRGPPDGERRGFGGRGGFGRGFGGGGYFGLLRMEKVREELKITEDQNAKIREAGEELRNSLQPPEGGFGNFRDLSDEEREAALAKMREFGEKMEKESRTKLAGILDETQMKRLRGLWVQQVGALAALGSEEIATELELTDDQKKQLAAQREEQRGQFGFGGRRRGEGGPPPGAGGGEGRGDFFERMQQRRKEADDKALAVLTEAQKTEFAEIKGAEFEFPQPDFGGFRGGPGGRNRGDGDGPPRRRGGPARDAE